MVAPFKWSPRALNTKVLALPWLVPPKPDAAQVQHDVLGARPEIVEARGLVVELVYLAASYGEAGDALNATRLETKAGTFKREADERRRLWRCLNR